MERRANGAIGEKQRAVKGGKDSKARGVDMKKLHGKKGSGKTLEFNRRKKKIKAKECTGS